VVILFLFVVVCNSFSQAVVPGSTGNKLELLIQNSSEHFNLNDAIISLDVIQTSPWITNISFTSELGTILPKAVKLTEVIFDVSSSADEGITGQIKFNVISDYGVNHEIAVEVNTSSDIPRISLWRESQPSKYDYNTIESDHIFKATCLGSDGKDFKINNQKITALSFYYKLDDEDFYYLFDSAAPSTKPNEISTFDSYLSTGLFKGVLYIKATATYYSNYNIVTSSKIISVKISDPADRFCHITFPNPKSEGAFDFEYPIRITGYVDAEDGFDPYASNILPVWDITAKNGITETCSSYQYDWPWQMRQSYPYLEKNIMDFLIEGEYICDESTCKNSRQDRFLIPELVKEIDATKVSSGELIWYSESDYPQIRPANYIASIGLVDANNYASLANPDQVEFIMPAWKLKFWDDPFLKYQYESFLEKTRYGAGNYVNMDIHRPFAHFLNYDMDIYLYDKDGTSVLNHLVVTESDYLDSSAAYRKITTLLFPIYDWSKMGMKRFQLGSNMEQGFYKLRMEEVDYYSNELVIQEKELQVCPLYVNWENNGNWPSNWPEPVKSEPVDYWTISTSTGLSYPLGWYSLSSNYRTDQEIQEVSIEHPGVTLTENYNADFIVCIGIPKSEGVDNFDELLAEYSVSLSKDGGSSWTKIKTASISDYLGRFDDHVEECHPTRFFRFSLGENLQGANIKVKFTTKGLNIATEATQDVHYDEIQIFYVKEDLINRPEDIAGNYNEDRITVSWSGSKSASKSTYYNVYRDGIKIGQTSNLFFEDTDITQGEYYNYCITLFEENYGEEDRESSLLDGSIYVLADNYYPPQQVEATTGTGTESGNVTITWIPPAVPDGLLRYNIYRNNEFLTSTKELNHTDCWVTPGEHQYGISAVYGTDKESSIVTDDISIVDVFLLPCYEYFENDGNIPSSWLLESFGGDLSVNWQFVDTSINGILPYDGDYFAYYGYEFYPEEDPTLPDIMSPSVLKTPSIDFTSYSEVWMRFMLNINKSVITYPDELQQLYLVLHDDINNVDFNIRIIPSTNTSGWVDTDYFQINTDNLSNSCHLEFIVKNSVLPMPESYFEICIDDLEIWADYTVPTPANIQITNDQGFISLKWDPVPGATAYKIYRSEYPDKNFAEIYTVIQTNQETQEIATSYTDVRKRVGTGVTMITPAVDTIKRPYYYKIAAVIDSKILLESSKKIINPRKEGKK
jgi:hypothetical protein